MSKANPLLLLAAQLKEVGFTPPETLPAMEKSETRSLATLLTHVASAINGKTLPEANTQGCAVSIRRDGEGTSQYVNQHDAIKVVTSSGEKSLTFWGDGTICGKQKLLKVNRYEVISYDDRFVAKEATDGNWYSEVQSFARSVQKKDTSSGCLLPTLKNFLEKVLTWSQEYQKVERKAYEQMFTSQFLRQYEESFLEEVYGKKYRLSVLITQSLGLRIARSSRPDFSKHSTFKNSLKRPVHYIQVGDAATVANFFEKCGTWKVFTNSEYTKKLFPHAHFERGNQGSSRGGETSPGPRALLDLPPDKMGPEEWPSRMRQSLANIKFLCEGLKAVASVVLLPDFEDGATVLRLLKDFAQHAQKILDDRICDKHGQKPRVRFGSCGPSHGINFFVYLGEGTVFGGLLDYNKPEQEGEESIGNVISRSARMSALMNLRRVVFETSGAHLFESIMPEMPPFLLMRFKAPKVSDDQALRMLEGSTRFPMGINTSPALLSPTEKEEVFQKVYSVCSEDVAELTKGQRSFVQDMLTEQTLEGHSAEQSPLGGGSRFDEEEREDSTPVS